MDQQTDTIAVASLSTKQAEPTVDSAIAASHVGHLRWTICALLFFAAIINYLDRQVIATLKDTLQAQHVWDEIGYSWVVFSFQAAYAIGLLIAGRVMDWLGTRKGFSLSVLIWSLASIGHALVSSVAGFSIARFALGLGEAVIFPPVSRQSLNGFREKNARLRPESSTPEQTSEWLLLL
jgi:MFS transporter, ACS family, hexuronate transporter